MKTKLREVALIVVLPLVLSSITLAMIGTSHAIKMSGINRIGKEWKGSIGIHVDCQELCQNINRLENIFLKFEKRFFIT